MKRLFVLLAALALTSAALAAVETYKIDPVHSSVNFSIRHFFSNVPGTFTKIGGSIVVDRNDLTKSTVEATIDISSVNTNSEKRDAHLRTDTFFDAAKFPTATFKSTAWAKTGDDTYDVTGNLTIKDVTKPVVLHVSSLGFGPGMNGAQLSGWSATTTLNRNDFGITAFPKVLGDDVAITINVEADLQKEARNENPSSHRQLTGVAPMGWGARMFGPGLCFHGSGCH
ncbi:MAG TPA: YceI family protein [Opitutaceae bacterium]|jgi:polyisoprenoid-binding protein YceI|nr:YceI family protein [Opitutaceae bacterium]